MAVSSTTDYLDDSFLTELFEDPLISQLIDRFSPSATTSSHLPNNGANAMNRRHWSQEDSGHLKSSSSTPEAPSSTTTTSSTDLKHLLNAEVVLKTDVFNGKRGTINTISYDGLATVTIDGGVQIRLPYCALQLISPQPGDKVIVTCGSLKGLPGTLLSAEGGDGIIMSQLDHKIWVVKLHTLAKMSPSGYSHQHHQLRPTSTSTMYSHQALSPSSPLTPTTPTSASFRPSSTMFLGAGSPVTQTTPTPMRSSPMYSSSANPFTNGSIVQSNPLSPHTPSPSQYSSASRQTHRGHVTTAAVAGPHSMFFGTDDLKQSVSSHSHSFLKTPPVNLKHIVGSLSKCEDGPSTKEWIEYLLRRPGVKRNAPSTDDDDKDDIKASVVQISLVCPVSQRRMEYPCRCGHREGVVTVITVLEVWGTLILVTMTINRGVHCKHLQCFDAEAYINMNKSWRPKMKLKTVNGSYHSSLAIKADSRLKCPVCNKHTPFDTLYIDKDLMEMICTTSASDVEWSGGAWRTIQKAPQDNGTDVIDLTLSDTDNE